MEPQRRFNRHGSRPAPAGAPRPHGASAHGPKGRGRGRLRREGPRPHQPHPLREIPDHTPMLNGDERPIPPLEAGNIRIIPLGGVEEIGRNMTLVEFGNDIIAIDCGFQFREEETPGVDYILPNTRYLEERREKMRGLFVTHGHLDHIGGIPYIIDRIGYPPVFTHDLRLDHIDGIPSENEEKEFSYFKDKKVLFLAADSTNVERPGFSLPEKIVQKNLDEIITQSTGRLIIGTFSSQLERIMRMLETAERVGKKVLIEGRSMKVNIEIVKHLGMLKVAE